MVTYPQIYQDIHFPIVQNFILGQFLCLFVCWSTCIMIFVQLFMIFPTFYIYAHLPAYLGHDRICGHTWSSMLTYCVRTLGYLTHTSYLIADTLYRHMPSQLAYYCPMSEPEKMLNRRILGHTVRCRLDMLQDISPGSFSLCDMRMV